MHMQKTLVWILTFHQLTLGAKRKSTFILDSFMEPCSLDNKNYVIKTSNSSIRNQNGLYTSDYTIDISEDLSNANLEASELKTDLYNVMNSGF